MIEKATWINIADEPLGCDVVEIRGFLPRDLVVNTQATIKPHRAQMRRHSRVKVVSVTPATFFAEKRDDNECIENTECLDVVPVVVSDAFELLGFDGVSPVEELALGGVVVDEPARLTWDLSAGCRPSCASTPAALMPSTEAASLLGPSCKLAFCKRAVSSE